jgi:SAM-dependent methyltransferase
MTGAEPFDAKGYWETRLDGDFSLSGVGELGLSSTYISWLYRVRAVAFRRALRRLGKGSALQRVLDVGSGTGFYIREWLRAGASEVTGLDITDVSVRELERRFPSASFVQADISKAWDPPMRTYDAASAFDVLFHVVDDGGFDTSLHNLHEALRPGGYLFVSDLFQHASVFHSGHQVGRSLLDWEAALDRNGFSIVDRHPIFWLMSDPTDSQSRVLRLSYRFITRITRQSPLLANAVGAVLFPVDRDVDRPP